MLETMLNQFPPLEQEAFRETCLRNGVDLWNNHTRLPAWPQQVACQRRLAQPAVAVLSHGQGTLLWSLGPEPE
jgi:hypothetical protein